MDPNLLPTLERLGIDLENSLLQEPRFLHDATLLGALHAELESEVGAGGAAGILFQLGFVHGLREACALLRDGLEPSNLALPPSPTRLPMRLQPSGDARDVAIQGCWPALHEAEAHLAALGPETRPTCHTSAGYTSGWLSGMLGARVLAVERSCGSCGAAECSFEAREADAWSRGEEAGPAALADALAFEDLCAMVEESLARDPAPKAAAEGFEPGSPAIHVWGPVMVLPFAGPDESLRALELIGRDRDARGVRVVVVDLSGTIVDDGFGAVALERILEAISSWGAEPVLAGVSPLSMPVVQELERSHLVLQKDLPEAIAAAFQIADAQRAAL